MMKKFGLYLTLLLSTVSIVLNGCATRSGSLEPYGCPKSSLKKKVMVSPFVDHSGLGRGVATSISRYIVDKIRASGKAIVFEAPHVGEFDEATELSYGVVVNRALLSKAEEMGMNMLLTGTISAVDKEERLGGVWPFRKPNVHFQVSLVVNLIDPQNGTVILTHMETDGIELNMEELEFTEKGWVSDQLKRKVLPKLAKRAAKLLIEAIESERWEGTILEVEDGSIRISAGKDVGVKPGHRFDVFGGRKVVKAADGRQFCISWKRIGRLSVLRVGETTSEARPLEGNGFTRGQIIVSLD